MSPQSGRPSTGASADDAARFLLNLAEAMHGAQTPTDVIEERLTAAAHRLGASTDFLLLQSFVGVEIRLGGHKRIELERIDFDPHWRLARMEALLGLADSIADGRRTLSQAQGELDRIVRQPRLYGTTIVIAAYAAYSAAVAARIGGGWLEMAVAGLLGVVGGAIHVGTIRYRSVDLQKSFFAGFAGGLLALVLSLVLPPFNLSSALFAGMTLLVPAMVITIATHELASDALESGAIRLTYGLLRFAMLGAGVAGAMKLWSLVLPLPAPNPSVGLPVSIVMAILVGGGAALVFCLQARLKDVGWMIFAVVLSYGVQELTKEILGPSGAPFASAFVLGVAAYLYARLPGRSAATIVVPGLLQLAPGFVGTKATLHLLESSAVRSEGFFSVLLIAVQLVLGLLLAGVLIRPRRTARTIAPAG